MKYLQQNSSGSMISAASSALSSTAFCNAVVTASSMVSTLGLTADIKIGTRNSYEVLKHNGKQREILYDTAENEEAQPLPRWLFPVKSNMEFLNMEAGDGRNQSLFRSFRPVQLWYVLYHFSFNFCKLGNVNPVFVDM